MTMALASIVLSVAAQCVLKIGMSGDAARQLAEQPLSGRSLAIILLQPAVIAGFALYGLGALVWLMVLAHWDVSKAYPLVGLGFALTLGIGFAMGDNVTIPRVVGVALICAGVALVGRS
jgi:multidrug transporter EmrE-like cation transporter